MYQILFRFRYQRVKPTITQLKKYNPCGNKLDCFRWLILVANFVEKPCARENFDIFGGIIHEIGKLLQNKPPLNTPLLPLYQNPDAAYAPKYERN